MNSKVYKCCAVPQCNNTTIKTPNKLFVYVPQDKTVRNKWLQLARRNPKEISPKTRLYFCDDHFNMPADMINFIEYQTMGSVSKIFMKPGCVPTKFDCQLDRRKRTSDPTEQINILKKQRNALIEEREKDLEKSISTKHLELGETSSGSSGTSLKFEDRAKAKCLKTENIITQNFQAKPDMDIKIVDLKDESTFNMSHFSDTKNTKNEATKMSFEFVGIIEEMESEDFKITKDEAFETSIEYFAVKEEVESSDMGEDYAAINESITVVKHEVDEYSLETIEVVQPENSVLYLKKRPEKGKKFRNTGEQLHQCETCQKKFPSVSNLNKHRKRHSGVRNYECEYCNRRFIDRPSLNNHLRTHTGEKPYSCKICDHRFIQLTNLKVHMRTHTGEWSYQCETCQKSFAKRSNFVVHQKMHLGIMDFECEHCKKRFARKESLNLHQKIHSDAKDYECEHCKKRFVTKTRLNRHRKIHSGPKDLIVN